MSVQQQAQKSASVGEESFTTIDVDERRTNVRNDEKGTIYTVTTVGGVSECSCPDYKYRRAAKGEHCKHIKAVESQQSDEKEISGPHHACAPTSRPEEFDHYTYFRCEGCGAECTDKRGLEGCC